MNLVAGQLYLYNYTYSSDLMVMSFLNKRPAGYVFNVLFVTNTLYAELKTRIIPFALMNRVLPLENYLEYTEVLHLEKYNALHI